MTARRLCWAAFAIALAVQAAMIVVDGSLSDWCFCAITEIGPPRVPPQFVLRFLEFARFPAVWATRGLVGLGGLGALGGFGLEAFFVFGLIGWFVAFLALLNGMVLAARIRIRIASTGLNGRRMWLASRESVRPASILLLGALLIAGGMAGGVMARRRWLAEAEQVFAATMAAASTGRALPRHVEFWMVERRGREYVYVDPAPGFAIQADPHESGDHFLDRFVVPYTYGGLVRFPSGARYEFTVLRGKSGWPDQQDGWTVDLHEEGIFRW